MKKIIFLLICLLAIGLLFGCTEETTNADNTNQDNTGNVVTQPNNTNDTTNNETGTDDEIPMPPALPE